MDPSTWVPVPWQVELTQGLESCFLAGAPLVDDGGTADFPRVRATPMCPVSAAAVKPGFAAGARAGAAQQDCAQGSEEISRPVWCYHQNSTQKTPHPSGLETADF